MRAAVAAAFRAEWGRVLAALIGFTGNWDLAEEATQEAFTHAMTAWARDGVPRSPGAWLTTAARHRAVDIIRRAAKGGEKLREAQILDHRGEPAPDFELPDDRLRLIFTCCHPALALPNRVALTLRSVAGLTTGEIGAAFGLDDKTVAQRIVRAKQKIRQAGIPYREPSAAQLPERTAGVLAVLYLLFNEGYSATSGPSPLRVDLSSEAIRLTRILAQLMPREPAVLGLLALLLLTDARRSARVDAAGELVTLEEQDRRRWDAGQIAEGLAVLDMSWDLGPQGVYQLQAAIAACHDRAPTPQDTDWSQITVLYRGLRQISPSAFVDLNHAIAVAMADGPSAGLALLDRLVGSAQLRSYHLLPATRADLLRRLGRWDDAARSYRQALELVGNDAERRFLQRRLAELPIPGADR